MVATRAVFETPELLENIIIFVPVKKILSLKRASRCCHQLIETSPRIRRARCLRPALFASNGKSIYYPGPCITTHPSLEYQFNRTGKEAMHRKFDISERSAERLIGLRGDYATTPRCQTMLIRLNQHSIDVHQNCVLYVKEAIKIGDMLDVRANLLLTYERFVLQQHKPPQSKAARKSERYSLCTTMHFAETWRTEGHI